MSSDIIATKAVSARLEAPPRAGRQALSVKALALGALVGSVAAILFAPDMVSVIADDDPGARTFFANEAARRRTPPTSFVTPRASPVAQYAVAPRGSSRAPGLRATAQMRQPQYASPARQPLYARPPVYVAPSRAQAQALAQAQGRAYAPFDLRNPAPAVFAIANATVDPGAPMFSTRAPQAQRAPLRLHKSIAAAVVSPARGLGPISTPASFEPMGRRAVCVRLCDGFHFPLGAVRGASDSRAQAGMCQSLCPGAPARVYVMPAGSEKIEDALSLDGRRYDRLPVAFRHASSRDDTCSCRPAGASVGSPLMSLLDDLTLRRGDAVMTARGVRVFRGSTRWPLRHRDFVRVGETSLSPSARAALATLDRLNAHTQRARAAAREAAAARIELRAGLL